MGQTLTPEVLSQVVAAVSVRCYPGPVDFSTVAHKQVGSYTLYCARLADNLDQLRALHAAHWAETEVHRHGTAMNPDYQRVLDLEQQGRYFLIIARHSSGDLVANYGLFLGKSTHTQALTASEDTLFVAREHRRGRLGVALIRYAEDALALLGAEELNVSVKAVNNVGPMIERMGYLPVGTQYTKLLKKEPANVLA